VERNDHAERHQYGSYRSRHDGFSGRQDAPAASGIAGMLYRRLDHLAVRRSTERDNPP